MIVIIRSHGESNGRFRFVWLSLATLSALFIDLNDECISVLDTSLIKELGRFFELVTALNN